MNKLRVLGGKKVNGNITINAAKNASLPLLALSLLTDKEISFQNLPNLSDVTYMINILTAIGASVHECNNMTSVSSSNLHTTAKIPLEFSGKLRASSLVLGPLLSRGITVILPKPGGCNIGNHPLHGSRPLNLHIDGLKKLGTVIQEKDDLIIATPPTDGLKGTNITIPTISVGATENLIMASILARGTTIINNAAIEPEISDLIKCANRMGSRISGIGTRKLTIEGISLSELKPVYDYSIIPDRIEAATYILAATITRGTIHLDNIILSHIQSLINILQPLNIKIHTNNDSTTCIDCSNLQTNLIQKIDISTAPYPEFPSDLQAPITSLLSTLNGMHSTITETVYENRLQHIPELQKMGAQIIIQDNTVKITGVKQLTAAEEVHATDLRAAAALLIAALSADGTTILHNHDQLTRGYDKIISKLNKCGCDIEII